MASVAAPETIPYTDGLPLRTSASLTTSIVEPLKARSLASLLARPSTATTATAMTADSDACSDGSYSGDDSDASGPSFRFSIYSKAEKMHHCGWLSGDEELSTTDCGDELALASLHSGDETSSAFPCVLDLISPSETDDADEEEDCHETRGDAVGAAHQLLTTHSRTEMLELRKAFMRRRSLLVPMVEYRTQIFEQPCGKESKSSERRGSDTICGQSGADEQVAKTARAAVAALAKDTFQPAYELLVQTIRTPDHFAVVLREVLDIAMADHHLVNSCVVFCVRLKEESRLQRVIGADGGPHSFRQTILNTCWPIFEQFLDSGSAHAGTVGYRARGSVRLLASFIERDILSPRLVVECSEALLGKFSKARPDVLELLLVLLQETSAKLDALNKWVHAPRLDKIFVRVHKLVSSDCGAVPQHLRQALKAIPCRRSAPGLERPQLLRLARDVLLAPPVAGDASGRGERQASAKAVLKKTLRDTSSIVQAVDLPPVQRCLHAESDITPDSNCCSSVAAPYNASMFRRELSAVLSELRASGNVAAAVKRIRLQHVPLEHQEKEYVDLLTRAVDISYKPSRRLAFAFAAGLASAAPSAFDRAACLAGIMVFFKEVYADLCDEVPKLPVIVRAELLPTLRSVFDPAVLDGAIPKDVAASLKMYHVDPGARR